MNYRSRITKVMLWPSIARIAATGAIFLFHYLKFMEYPNYNLDLWGITTFCFLSGYLISIKKYTRYGWIIRKYFEIMVPYWVVIVPVIIINLILHYKDVASIDYIFTILGGNLFIENPIYVIAWYITFILILYIYAFLESFFRSFSIIIFMLFGIIVFTLWLNLGYYFFAFLLGLRLSNFQSIRQPDFGKNVFSPIYSVCYRIQKNCYSFFLVHGAVLLFFVKMTAASKIEVLIFSLILSIAITPAVNIISKPLMNIAVGKSLMLFEKVAFRFNMQGQ